MGPFGRASIKLVASAILRAVMIGPGAKSAANRFVISGGGNLGYDELLDLAPNQKVTSQNGHFRKSKNI
jgi:hypothetical protein